MTSSNSTFRLLCVAVVVASAWFSAVFPSHARSAPVQEQAAESPFTINLADPESSVPTQERANRSPLEFGYFLMELARLATEAEDQKNLNEAAKFYRAISIAAPTRPTGPRKLCEIYQVLGDQEAAYRWCRAVLSREDGNSADVQRWVHLLATRPKPLDAEAVHDAHEAIESIAQTEQGKLPAAWATCELAVATDDVAALRACVPVVTRASPNHPGSVAFAWRLALADNNVDDANQLIERSAKLGVDPRAIESMHEVMKKQQEAAKPKSSAMCQATSEQGKPTVLALVILMLVGRFRARRVGARDAKKCQ